MTQVIADKRDVDFVLYDQLQIEGLFTNGSHHNLNKKTADLIISEARTLATKELYPLLMDGDRETATFRDGTVTLPESFHRAYELIREGDWIAATVSVDSGGQGMPHVIGQAIMDYIMGANYPLSLFGYSALGAGEIIEHFGTEKQKKMFMKKLYSGEWGGHHGVNGTQCRF